MTYTGALQSDLRRVLLTVAGLPAQIAWQARSFTPDLTAPMLREALVPVDSNVATLGWTAGQTREDALYDLAVLHPSQNADLFAMHDLADRISAAFWSGLRIGGTEAHGNVVKTTKGAAAPEFRTEWIVLPIRVRLFIYRRTVASALA